MTATTKGRRDELLRLAHKIIRPLSVSRVDVDEFNRMCALIVPNLLSDSERLAAIEAVTGDEVRELVARLRSEMNTPAGVTVWTAQSSVNAILSLSAKVEEQAEEIERLKRHLSDEERQHEQTIHDRDEAEDAVQWLDQQTGGDGEYVFNTLEPHTCNCTPRRMCGGIAERYYVVRAERDTLRRLLTETAVTALEYYSGRAFCLKARAALSTIRAQMEGGNG